MSGRVLLVDDHAMLRTGLRLAITQHTQFSIAGEAATGADAVRLALELTPDIIVMDVHLPDMNGIDATRQILAKLTGGRVLMFSGDVDCALVDKALEAGACAYILKQGCGDELIKAIEAVMAGRIYLSPEVNDAVLRNYRTELTKEQAHPAKPELSEREKHLLRSVADGKRNKEIADQLGLSPKSIEAYRARLMHRLGCQSTAEMIRFGIREGIVCA